MAMKGRIDFTKNLSVMVRIGIRSPPTLSQLPLMTDPFTHMAPTPPLIFNIQSNSDFVPARVGQVGRSWDMLFRHKLYYIVIRKKYNKLKKKPRSKQ